MSLVCVGTRPAEALGQLAAGLVPHSYAGTDDVEAMAERLRSRIGVEARARLGAHYAVRLSPGTLAVRSRVVGFDVAEPARDYTLFAATGEKDTTRAAKRGAITEWSRDSRARMVRAVAELDYSTWHLDGGVLAMVTFTLPGDWQRVAPTGRDFKRLIDLMRKRWVRAVGPWRGLWKLEFQRRGAPHLHALMRVPALVAGERFETWLSRTWAEVVAADDDDCYRCWGRRSGRCRIDCTDEAHAGPCDGCTCDVPDTERSRHLRAGTAVDFSGVRFSDPRRTAIYFLKHSAKTSDGKEYQHIVPEAWRGEGKGPGRFWGVWGLRRAVGEVWMDRTTWVRARRILRHIARASAARSELARLRHEHRDMWEHARALVTMRRPRGPSGLRQAGGWVLVNDGVAAAFDVGRALVLAVDVEGRD